MYAVDKAVESPEERQMFSEEPEVKKALMRMNDQKNSILRNTGKVTGIKPEDFCFEAAMDSLDMDTADKRFSDAFNFDEVKKMMGLESSVEAPAQDEKPFDPA